MKEVIHWPSILAQKAFWIYYLRLFQGFDGDYVAACCDFFGIDQTELEGAILHDLYQTHRSDDDDIILHVLSLPAVADATLEIEFQPYGPGEQFRLVVGEERISLADVDVDDVCAPLFPLRDLPHVAARLRSAAGQRHDLARTYGALLLYKLTHVAPEDDLDALADILRAALPPGLFSAVERARVLDSERRTWQTQQRRPRPLRVVDHRAWQQLVEKER